MRPLALVLTLLIGLCPLVGPSRALGDVLVNDNAGATGTAFFTQSETSTLVFGNTLVIGFNDAGSNASSSNKFTGYSVSTDGGLTFTDRGTLPTNPAGDAGDPLLARNNSTGTIYLTTSPLSGSTVPLFRSFDNGATFTAPVNAAPGATGLADLPRMAVDNFPGSNQGNVYVVTRTFGPGDLRFFRSTDGGATFGPSGGTTLVPSGGPLANIAVGPDHSIYVPWFDQTAHAIEVSKSTDGGVTFAAPVIATTVASTGLNGDLGLTGIRNGTTTPSSFRSFILPQLVTNPVSGQLYMVYNDRGAGGDKADVFLNVSTDGGATWTPRIRVNQDLTANDQWQPTVTVSPDGSHLGIFWYDRRADLQNNMITYFGTSCATTGSLPVCGPNFAVSDVAFLPEFGRDAILNSLYMGDYDVAAADNSFYYVSWGDNRLPLLGGGDRMDPNVFFDKVAIADVVGAPEPSALLLVATGLTAVGWCARRLRRPTATAQEG